MARSLWILLLSLHRAADRKFFKLRVTRILVPSCLIVGVIWDKWGYWWVLDGMSKGGYGGHFFFPVRVVFHANRITHLSSHTVRTEFQIDRKTIGVSYPVLVLGGTQQYDDIPGHLQAIIRSIVVPISLVSGHTEA